MTDKKILWVGAFRFPHALVTRYTYAPTWAAAKTRLLRRIANEDGVTYRSLFDMFDGTRQNYTIEREDR